MQISASSAVFSLREKLRALRRRYYSDRRRHFINAPMRALRNGIQKCNGGVYAIEICSNFGFFAYLQTALYILQYCEDYALRPAIRFTGGAYSQSSVGASWLESYFTSKLEPLPDQFLFFSKIRSPHDLGLHIKYHDSFTIEQAHSLFNKYLSVNGNIIAELDSFVEEHSIGEQFIGVHYRGTDKSTEAPRVPWHSVRRGIEDLITATKSVRGIFVASDEPELIEWLRSIPLGLPIVSLDNTEIYRNGVATHLTSGDGYVKGKEALLNSLVLSRCGYCLKTASHLSGWSKIFNPALRVVMLNKPYDRCLWFPDNKIWESQYHTVATVSPAR
jgi:hypothetical protein